MKNAAQETRFDEFTALGAMIPSSLGYFDVNTTGGFTVWTVKANNNEAEIKAIAADLKANGWKVKISGGTSKRIDAHK
jgi:hypothetical protein